MLENHQTIKELQAAAKFSLTPLRSNTEQLVAHTDCSIKELKAKLVACEGMITLCSTDTFLGRYDNVAVAIVQDNLFCYTL